MFKDGAIQEIPFKDTRQINSWKIMRTHANHITKKCKTLSKKKPRKNDWQTLFNSKIGFVLRWQKQTKAHNTIHSIEQSRLRSKTIISTTITTTECTKILKTTKYWNVKNNLQDENYNGNENKGQQNTK